MMNDIVIEADALTPRVHVEAAAGKVTIEGASYPDSAGIFFGPVFDWIRKFMEEEMDAVVEVSALTGKYVGGIIDTIFRFLPIRAPIIADTSDIIHPALNVDSKLFVSELIREKAFLFLRNEIPYSLTCAVDAIEERKRGAKYINARIITNSDHYKGMIVGHEGRMIKEISMAVRKELETATGSHVYVDLTVEVDRHWMEQM